MYIYNILLIILSIFLFPFALFKYLSNRGLSNKSKERLGFLPDDLKEYINRGESGKLIWIHAGSIGEVKIAKNIIDQLQESIDNLRFIISTGGTTGQEMAEKFWPKEQIFFLPLDLPWIIKKVVFFINPDLFILIETDLWPNLIHYLDRNDNKTVLINGSINQFDNYKYFPWLLAKILKKMDLISVQTEEEKDKFKNLSIPEKKLKVGGSLKFLESKNNDIKPEEKKQLVNKFNLAQRKVIVAGSTHKGEERKIIRLFSCLKNEIDDILLIIAPRDISRSDEIMDIVSKFNLSTIKKTGIKNKVVEEDVIILDTIGELSRIYSIAVISFVGGTLVDKGGHNLLEPAIYGKPVFFGPYHYNIQNLAAILQKYEVGFKIKNQEEFLHKAKKLINNSERLKQIRKNAKKMFREQNQVLDYNINLIKLLLENNCHNSLEEGYYEK